MSITALPGGTKFIIGDIVRVKGLNGPKMVVTELRGNGKVMCLWFDEMDVKEHLFNIEVLSGI